MSLCSHRFANWPPGKQTALARTWSWCTASPPCQCWVLDCKVAGYQSCTRVLIWRLESSTLCNLVTRVLSHLESLYYFNRENELDESIPVLKILFWVMTRYNSAGHNKQWQNGLINVTIFRVGLLGLFYFGQQSVKVCRWRNDILFRELCFVWSSRFQ